MPAARLLAAGKFADLVAVPGDPPADSKLVMKPNFVMKGGVISKQSVSVPMPAQFRAGVTRD